MDRTTFPGLSQMTTSEAIDIPILPSALCPACDKEKKIYNKDTGRLECLYCGHEKMVTLTGYYMLVQFPEDTSYFEENNIGYPSSECEDSGALYVPEEDYIKVFCKEPETNQFFQPLCFPESQELQNDPKYKSYTELINDEKGLFDFGSAAYWVPICCLT